MTRASASAALDIARKRERLEVAEDTFFRTLMASPFAESLWHDWAELDAAEEPFTNRQLDAFAREREQAHAA